jgi:sugar lactone lactonase YvrE
MTGSLTVVATLPVPPGNITLLADGRIILSLHQFDDPDMCVAELVDGGLRPFPNGPGSDRIEFESVLGIQADANGHVWMLDNGNRNQVLPKLVAWDTGADRLARVIYLPPPITHADSFINDVAVDLTHNVVFISDPIQAGSAIIRVDLATGEATRILQGHVSVVPEDMDLVIDGTAVQLQIEDGSFIRPHLGVNGIVLDARNEWLYFCPMHSTSMYRARTEDLCNLELSGAALEERVERYSDKPICDGISIDVNDNVYVGDLVANGVGVIKADRSYQLLVVDEKLAWTDSLSFGPDGFLYCDSNQLHRSGILNAGTDAWAPPYHIIRLQPLAPGVAGR